MKRKMLCESEATVGEFQGLGKCAGADLLRFQIVFFLMIITINYFYLYQYTILFLYSSPFYHIIF